MWSVALGVLLTTLRYLAPATLLTLFWGQHSFICRLLKSIDTAFRAIVFSSEEQKQEVLRWLSDTGPVRIQRLDTVWRHGWIVCSVLDAALPGTCAGHAPSRLSLKHAQAIAEHYLGVEPVFSRHELEANDNLSRIQEWKLATYLGRIKQALSQITPPVSKPVSERASPETSQFSMDYIAKGAGLTAAQVNNKMYFKIYPTSQQSLDPGEITILIRGPKDTYGMSVLPPLLGKSQMIRQQLIGLDATPSYTENALPITAGATYLRAYGKNDMNKTFHIPKTKYDIEIEAKIRNDYIRVGYTVHFEGRHDISITSRGQHIAGSPFVMKSSTNIIDTLERENSCLEDGEEISIKDIGTERKVVLRIVDFVTEKMLLRENGSLEKISDDEAEKLLMTKTKPTNENTDAASTESDMEKTKKFNNLGRKIIRINQVCKTFGEIVKQNKLKPVQNDKIHKSSNKQPDIVNSTLNDSKSNSLFLTVSEGDRNSKSVAVPTCEKLNVKEIKLKSPTTLNVPPTEIEANTPDDLEESEIFESHIDELLRTESSSLSSNPFLNDIYEQESEKDLRTFVKSEYETKSSQSEEITKLPIQIVVEEDPSATPSPIFSNNPFIDPDIITMERPKTPVLKIIKGEVKDRDDSIYVDRQAELFAEELQLVNEFINPLFAHKHQMVEEKLPTTDFIIGAPVSLPPMVRAETPEKDVDSIVIRHHSENSNVRLIENYIHKDDKSIDSLTPTQCSNSSLFDKLETTDVKSQENNNISSTFHSIDSSYTDNVDGLILSNNAASSYTEANKLNINVTPKKDMWDSAYVSIDESTSTPDSNSNKNDSIESSDKLRIPPNDDYFNMGPEEKEIWLTCKDLRDRTDDSNTSKLDTSSKKFTPILEESDKNLSIEIKDDKRNNTISTSLDTPPVPVTFAKLNTNFYLECFRNKLDTNNVTETKENEDTKMEHKTKLERRESVDSASGETDVKRRAKQLEGTISEVQANVTESGSVSQTLRQIRNYRRSDPNPVNKETNESSDECHNIVIEKKLYWDEKIREIEAKNKEEECKVKPRRLSTRNLIQNDSLTKKRAKEVANNFMPIKDKRFIRTKSTIQNNAEVIKEEQLRRNLSDEKLKTDSKSLKWRRYWDIKLESKEKYEKESKSPVTKNAKIISSYINHVNSENVIEEYNKPEHENIEDRSATFPVKEELPEEVFKAFETSPKRFFGTSRKQILNKLDSFLDKPSTADSSSTDSSVATPDTGLVCSRISLFHTISKTEEPSWVRRKCQSMQNISMRKFSESSIYSTDDDAEVKMKYTTRTSSSTPISNNNLYETKRPELCKVTENGTSYKHAGIENIPLKEKRARLVQRIYSTSDSFDETLYNKHKNEAKVSSEKSAFKEINNNITQVSQISDNFSLRKSVVSKSEMDIFNKATDTCEDNLDIHKSYDELPKPCVKNFISLYESVSSSDEKEQSLRRSSRCSKKSYASSSSSGAANKTTSTQHHLNKKHAFKQLDSAIHTKNHARENWKNKSFESMSSSSIEPRSLDSTDQDIIPSQQQPEKETTYVAFSDIELEIVENQEPKGKQEAENNSNDYKSRFKMAKQYFQSLEELRPVKPLKKPNECEMLLMKSSTESLDTGRPQKQKKTKKTIAKSDTLPSSWISNANPCQDESSNKLTKISEKFNVEDLFNDVMEGKISRQGSLRGIPHKKAVLEAFRSMESLALPKISSCDITVSQLNQFAKENHMKTAQNYLNEYPYLPTTEPSKYNSRLDAKAHGLISLKELKNKPRRNSVPDLRLNTTFTVDL